MRTLDRTTPEKFILDFFTAFTQEIIGTDEDPAVIMDRFHTPDVVQYADGNRLDRDKLVAHIRPVRKNLISYRLDVHEAIADGDVIAARFTIHAEMRKDRLISTEVHLFGEFTPDGQLRSAHQLTRTLPTPSGENRL